MKHNKKTKIIVIISIILALIIISATIIIITKKEDKKEQEIAQKEKIDQMEDYDYYLEDNATEYYKELYNNLKDVLKEEINEEEYAKIVSKLFITDLFTLDNKVTSSDVGGLQFIHNDFKEDFINIAKTTIYSNVENNIYKDRTQELPIVRKVDITNIKKDNFTYKNKKYDSYNVSLTIEYEKDLGYPVEYNITLIKNDKYLQIAKGE